MAAIVFPYLPAVGDLWPLNPGEGNVTQYRWDGTKWVTQPVFISLGSENQKAYNQYQWPETIGTAGYQLTNDGAGNLTWAPSASVTFRVIDVLEPFDGSRLVFSLVTNGTTTPYSPDPVDNIVVFLGGVPQTPNVAYTVFGSTITFTEAPLLGTTFYAISTVPAAYTP